LYLIEASTAKGISAAKHIPYAITSLGLRYLNPAALVLRQRQFMYLFTDSLHDVTVDTFRVIGARRVVVKVCLIRVLLLR
jgi:hypothetical protein